MHIFGVLGWSRPIWAMSVAVWWNGSISSTTQPASCESRESNDEVPQLVPQIVPVLKKQIQRHQSRLQISTCVGHASKPKEDDISLGQLCCVRVCESCGWYTSSLRRVNYNHEFTIGYLSVPFGIAGGINNGMELGRDLYFWGKWKKFRRLWGWRISWKQSRISKQILQDPHKANAHNFVQINEQFESSTNLFSSSCTNLSSGLLCNIYNDSIARVEMLRITETSLMMSYVAIKLFLCSAFTFTSCWDRYY